jgi:hypothetical protein
LARGGQGQGGSSASPAAASALLSFPQRLQSQLLSSAESSSSSSSDGGGGNTTGAKSSGGLGATDGKFVIEQYALFGCAFWMLLLVLSTLSARALTRWIRNGTLQNALMHICAVLLTMGTVGVARTAMMVAYSGHGVELGMNTTALLAFAALACAVQAVVVWQLVTARKADWQVVQAREVQAKIVFRKARSLAEGDEEGANNLITGKSLQLSSSLSLSLSLSLCLPVVSTTVCLSSQLLFACLN